MPAERIDSGQGPRAALEGSGVRTRRAELALEESRGLRGSSGISTVLCVGWLLLVWFGPRTDISHLLPPEERPIEVKIENPPPPPAPQANAEAPKPDEPKTPPKTKPDRATLEAEQNSRRVAAAAAAFGGGGGSAPAPGPVGDVSNVLRGTDVVHGAAAMPGAATGGKAVLAYGQGGQGSRTPGRTDFGGGGNGAGGSGVGSVGGIGSGAGIGHAGVSMSAPKALDGQGVAGATRDMADLGTTVREREPQLRFCYVEYGLKSDPTLAGSVTLSLTISGPGAVTAAKVTERTWSGEGATAAESCILQKVRAWKFAPSSNGAGTYEFAFNFTK